MTSLGTGHAFYSLSLFYLLPKEHVVDGVVHPTDWIVGNFMGEIRGARARHVCVN
jgi:hypothetical protein